MNKLGNQQWLLTVSGKDKSFHHVTWDGSLASYAYEYKDEPIIFAHKISESEYLELAEIL